MVYSAYTFHSLIIPPHEAGMHFTLLASDELASGRSNTATILVTCDTRNLEDSVDDTTDTLSGNETSGNSVSVDIEVLGVLRLPVRGNSGPNCHSSSVLRLAHGEGKTDAHHVGVVCPHPLEAADPDVVADEDHEGAEGSEGDGEVARRWRDGECRISDGDCGGTPAGYTGNTKGASFGVDVDDAWVGGSEEGEHGRGKEDGNDRSEGLSEPLVNRGSAEEETGTEIADKISSLPRKRLDEFRTVVTGLKLLTKHPCYTWHHRRG